MLLLETGKHPPRHTVGVLSTESYYKSMKEEELHQLIWVGGLWGQQS